MRRRGGRRGFKPRWAIAIGTPSKAPKRGSAGRISQSCPAQRLIRSRRSLWTNLRRATATFSTARGTATSPAPGYVVAATPARPRTCPSWNASTAPTAPLWCSRWTMSRSSRSPTWASRPQPTAACGSTIPGCTSGWAAPRRRLRSRSTCSRFRRTTGARRPRSSTHSIRSISSRTRRRTPSTGKAPDRTGTYAAQPTSQRPTRRTTRPWATSSTGTPRRASRGTVTGYRPTRTASTARTGRAASRTMRPMDI